MNSEWLNPIHVFWSEDFLRESDTHRSIYSKNIKYNKLGTTEILHLVNNVLFYYAVHVGNMKVHNAAIEGSSCSTSGSPSDASEGICNEKNKNDNIRYM